MKSTAALAALALSACTMVPDGNPPGDPPPAYVDISHVGRMCSGAVMPDGRMATADHCGGMALWFLTYGEDISVSKTVNHADRAGTPWLDAQQGERVRVWCRTNIWSVRMYEGRIVDTNRMVNGLSYVVAQIDKAGITYLGGCSGTPIFSAERDAILGLAVLGRTNPSAYTSGATTGNMFGRPSRRVLEIASGGQG